MDELVIPQGRHYSSQVNLTDLDHHNDNDMLLVQLKKYCYEQQDESDIQKVRKMECKHKLTVFIFYFLLIK
jgi:hypothetical protein